MRRPYLVLDVFTDRRYGGNPLAVLPDAGGLNPAQMQRIAAEFNLSETVFVQAPSDPSRLADLRIFTPRAEIAFAGHPTVGAALALAGLGRVAPGPDGPVRFVLGELAGPVPVTVTFADGQPVEAEFTAPQPPRLGSRLPAHDVAAMLGLASSQLVVGTMPVIASCGTPFLFVELVDRAALAAAAMVGSADLGEAQGVFMATRDVGEASADWRARMFAPAHGIAEDPATGSAAAAFAGLLAGADPAPEGEFRWRIAQGIEMGRPSMIAARAVKQRGAAVQVLVAGSAVLVAEGTIEVGQK